MGRTRAELISLLRRHDIWARKGLGQHFLVDPTVAERMVALARLHPGCGIVEIGPGVGSLSVSLVETRLPLVLVELDERFAPILEEELAGAEPEPLLVQGDALRLGWEGVLAGQPSVSEWVLVSNLPYSIGTRLVIDLLEGVPSITRMVVMLQKEVADRLTAAPGSRAIGLSTVKVGWYAECRRLMRVPPGAFHPRPAVDSAVIEIERRSDCDAGTLRDLAFSLAERGYRQRRRMLRSSLAGMVTPPEFSDADVRPTDRPEDLSVADWRRLALSVASSEHR